MKLPGIDLIYFAFPKCGSELMRKHLALTWDNKYANKWDDCSLLYCHVRPSRAVACPEFAGMQMFTVVRNTYARLVSSYNYLLVQRLIKNTSFDAFIESIAIASRDGKFESLPFCWMFAPFDLYFDGVIDRMRVFQLDALDEVDAFLSPFGVASVPRKVVNSRPHAPFRTFYSNPKTVTTVELVYAYEIERFGYKM